MSGGDRPTLVFTRLPRSLQLVSSASWGLRLSRSSAVLHREVCAQRPRCREIVEGGPDTAGDDDSEQGIADGFSPIEGGQQIARQPHSLGAQSQADQIDDEEQNGGRRRTHV